MHISLTQFLFTLFHVIFPRTTYHGYVTSTKRWCDILFKNADTQRLQSRKKLHPTVCKGELIIDDKFVLKFDRTSQVLFNCVKPKITLTQYDDLITKVTYLMSHNGYVTQRFHNEFSEERDVYFLNKHQHMKYNIYNSLAH